MTFDEYVDDPEIHKIREKMHEHQIV